MAQRDIDQSTRYSVEGMSLAISNAVGTPDVIVDQFEEVAIATTYVEIEIWNDRLALVQTSERGSPSIPKATAEKRKSRVFKVPHVETSDLVMAEALQNVRAFGGDTTEPFETAVSNMEMALRADVDLTLSNMALGAMMGVLRDADGSVLYNYYDEYGIAPEPTVYFGLGAGGATSVRRKAMEIKRTISRNLRLPPTAQFSILALAGDEFFDELVDSEEAREAFKRSQENQFARDNLAFDQFVYAGITWRNYRGTDGVDVGGPGDTEAGFGVGIRSDQVRFAPIGLPGLYKRFNAPADYTETANTPGLPYYGRQVPHPNREEEKGRKVVVQANPLFLPTRPKSLMRGALGKSSVDG